MSTVKKDHSQKKPKVVWAKSQIQLAECIGVDRRSIINWSKDPNCPGCTADGRYNVEAWRKWSELNKRLPTRTATEWNAKKKEKECELLEFKIRILSRDYIPAKRVEAIGSRLGADLKAVITTLHLMAPSLAGLSVGDIEKALRDKEDDFMRQVHELPEKVEALMETDGEQFAALEEIK